MDDILTIFIKKAAFNQTASLHSRSVSISLWEQRTWLIQHCLFPLLMEWVWPLCIEQDAQWKTKECLSWQFLLFLEVAMQQPSLSNHHKIQDVIFFSPILSFVNTFKISMMDWGEKKSLIPRLTLIWLLDMAGKRGRISAPRWNG